MKRIELTEEQWDGFSWERQHDDNSALRACCADLSSLRREILGIRSTFGRVSDTQLDHLKCVWNRCRRGHGFDDAKYPQWKTLRSLIEQAGLEWCKEA